MATDVTTELLAFVREQLPEEQRSRVSPTTQLITEGLLDSMGIVLVAAFVEERFGVTLDNAELRAGRTESVAAVAARIRDRS